MRTRRLLRTRMVQVAGRLFAVSLGATMGGCGFNASADINYPAALRDADGNIILLEEVEEIVNDGELTDDEKRTALEELGIEDPDIIDALLGT